MQRPISKEQFFKFLDENAESVTLVGDSLVPISEAKKMANQPKFAHQPKLSKFLDENPVEAEPYETTFETAQKLSKPNNFRSKADTITKTNGDHGESQGQGFILFALIWGIGVGVFYFLLGLSVGHAIVAVSLCVLLYLLIQLLPQKETLTQTDIQANNKNNVSVPNNSPKANATNNYYYVVVGNNTIK